MSRSRALRLTGLLLSLLVAGALVAPGSQAAPVPSVVVASSGSVGSAPSTLGAAQPGAAATRAGQQTKAQKKAAKRKAVKKRAAKKAAKKQAKKKQAARKKKAASKKAAQKKAAQKKTVQKKAAKKTPVPVTVHHLPFVCDQSWTGSTRSYHSPSAHSIDFNATDDLGKPVVASAAGRVITSNNTATTGYGRHVVLDHGNGETSVYAHLQHAHVVAGTWVDQGALIGQLGSTGNSSGPHLHYEQKVGRTVVAPWMNRLRYVYGTSRSTNCADVPLAGDFFEGDGAEVAVFRRTAQAEVHVRTPQGTTRVLTVGSPTDEVLVGDWTGEGLQSIGTFAPITRTFTLAGEAGFFSLTFGQRGDRPVAGDWDGDGRWEVGVRRPGTSTFRMRSAAGSVTTLKLGAPGDLPVTGDWDGDGITDVGVYDPTTATFTLRTRGAKQVTSTVRHGKVGDQPVVADWNADGVTDLGTWSPTTATFTKRIAATPAATTARSEAVRHGRGR